MERAFLFVPERAAPDQKALKHRPFRHISSSYPLFLARDGRVEEGEAYHPGCPFWSLVNIPSCSAGRGREVRVTGKAEDVAADSSVRQQAEEEVSIRTNSLLQAQEDRLIPNFSTCAISETGLKPIGRGHAASWGGLWPKNVLHCTGSNLYQEAEEKCLPEKLTRL